MRPFLIAASFFALVTAASVLADDGQPEGPREALKQAYKAAEHGTLEEFAAWFTPAARASATPQLKARMAKDNQNEMIKDDRTVKLVNGQVIITYKVYVKLADCGGFGEGSNCVNWPVRDAEMECQAEPRPGKKDAERCLISGIDAGK
jgi:hypothetical protein